MGIEKSSTREETSLLPRFSFGSEHPRRNCLIESEINSFLSDPPLLRLEDPVAHAQRLRGAETRPVVFLFRFCLKEELDDCDRV
ncbi:hypothetical protein NPIL_262651 [Nephila pilipes]|uniref:Uncharacterized protein n=1 Tax=Nephila pilipes TaxID=299642 RepID=A0A8X6PHY2_NEPPI|nr:hypothetical protein NPIL_262651 [Nephila pilipes]